jgi:electron transfer flavoprotein alpha subunit
MVPEVWSFLESEGGRLQDAAHRMAAEARRTAGILGGCPGGIVFGQTDEVLSGLKRYGLQKLYLFPGDPLLSPEIVARSISKAAERWHPRFILFSSTPAAAEVAARTAAQLSRGLISNCIDFEKDGERLAARKTVYNGKANAVFTWDAPPPYLATIDPSALEDVKDKGETEPEVIQAGLAEGVPLAALTGRWEINPVELELNEARVVIGVGGGVDKESMGLIERLARVVGGVIGGSRIAVYNDLIPLRRQIGTTGRWLDSRVYLAIGISGAPHHVMGIKEVKNLIAVNTDKQANIFKYATLGAVADWRQVVPLLTDLLEADAKGQL